MTAPRSPNPIQECRTGSLVQSPAESGRVRQAGRGRGRRQSCAAKNTRLGRREGFGPARQHRRVGKPQPHGSNDIAEFVRSASDDAADLDQVWLALEGCWSGILVNDVGRAIDCGGTVRIVGEFCERCPAGRLQLLEGVACCNACSHTIGPVTEFLDAGPSIQNAISFLMGQASIAKLYRRGAAGNRSSIPRGRAYWAVTKVRGQPAARVVWQGQKCPSCPSGHLEYFVPPEEAEEGLMCDNSWCRFGLSVKASTPEPTPDIIRQWKDIPLEGSPSPWIVRAERILGTSGCMQLES